ncbi:MAG: FAD-dependent oxidoreductase [Deltaproteobacteria bacterium]|nr:FAD-dependent oxidoreductase [Deltaproteobacteria bacterium]
MSDNLNRVADVVAIGGGGAGLAAAITAASGGVSVIVIERMAGVGGSTTFAEGMFAAESSMQFRKNIILTKDDVFKRHMEATNWRANPHLVRAFIDKSANTIEWLQDLGVEFIEPAALYPGGPRTWHTIKGYGAAMVKVLLKKAKENKVQIITKTTAKKLITEEGRVTGLIAEDRDGNTIRASAKAVVITDGGFANNKEMLEKYTNAGPDLLPMGNEGKMGEGIQMAWEAGAAAEGTDVLQLITPVVRTEKGLTHLAATLTQPYLWINKMGKRFCDEGIFQFPFVGNAQANQKDQIMFHIFDENTKNYMKEHGIDCGMGMYVPTTTKLEEIDADLKRGNGDGEVFMANSIEELAANIHVDGKVLVATIDEYNKFCDQGHDDLFAKDPKYLQPVRTPRFYAVRGFPSFTGTLGGIKINHRTEVLNKDFEVIPGLYAAGNCAGGMYGDSYDSASAGTALGFAINSGRMAGESALAYISGK